MVLIAIIAFVGMLFLTVPLALVVHRTMSAKKRQRLAAVLETTPPTAPQRAQVEASRYRRANNASAIPWLNRQLRNLEIIPRLQSLLSQADLKWTPGRLMLLTGCAYIFPAYLLWIRYHSLLLSGLLCTVPATLPIGYVLLVRHRRLASFEANLAEALDLMAGALRVGQSLNSAIGLIARECPAPLAGEFRIVFEERNFGLDIRVALQNLLHRVPLQDLKMVVTAILIHYESGGNLAEILDKTAQMVRQRLRLKKQIKVYTAQGRLTGWILTVLPVVLGIALYLLSPATTSLLWTRTVGIKMLLAAAGGVVLGSFLIQRIVRIDV